MADLGGRSLAAVFWGGGGTLGRIVLQLATQILLARILGPAQYGLFAIGAVVIGFSNFFSDIGLAYGLIQKAEVGDEDVRFVFTWQVIIGGLVTAMVMLASDPIAAFFGDAGARDVVAGLSVVCLVNALMAPSQNLLKRNLDFKRIQLGSLGGYFVGYVLVGLPLALSGAAVWALVAAWLTQSLVCLATYYLATRHPLRPLFWFAGARQMMHYGATVLVTNIINWVIGNIDRILIGRFFSSREIGLYATAYNLLYSPASAVLGVVQPIFFSAGARIADERDRLIGIHLSLVAATALVVLPASVAVAVVAETAVLALYGPQWAEAGGLLAPLALAMPFFLFWGFTTPLLWLGGKPQREFRVQLPMALLWAALCWLAARHSPVAVAWAVTLLFAMRYALIFVAARNTVGIGLPALWRALRGGVLLALTSGFVAWLADRWLGAVMLPATWRLIGDGMVTLGAYFALLWLCPGLIGVDGARLLKRLAVRSPAPVTKWLNRLPAAE